MWVQSLEGLLLVVVTEVCMVPLVDYLTLILTRTLYNTYNLYSTNYFQ